MPDTGSQVDHVGDVPGYIIENLNASKPASRPGSGGIHSRRGHADVTCVPQIIPPNKYDRGKIPPK